MKQGEVVADRYELRKALDGGYYNEVWIAMDLRLERECLLKMPSLPPSSPEERDRLTREARTIASIPNKDHVAEVFDAGDWAGRPFFTQELLPGGSLAERLQKCGGKLQAAQFLPVFMDVCSGVLQAHQVGIIHGDLKPENIVFSAQDSAKVVDFGTAFRLQAGTPPSHQVMATLPFQSPEHFRPRTYGKLDQRTDIWALGIIAYLVLTGRHPYEMSEQASYVDWADAVEAPPSLRHAPADWAPIISRCLQPQKRYRFPALSDLIAELAVLHRTYASTATARSRELYKQGVDFFNNGDLRQAAHNLQEAARLNPSPTLLHWVGHVRQALNDIPGAREAYQQALEIDPTYV
ncbi:MAG: protein kinase, partial [Armatimonadia bacterium]